MTGEVTITSTWGISLGDGTTKPGFRFEQARNTASGRKGKPLHLGTLYAEDWPSLLSDLGKLLEQEGDLAGIGAALLKVKEGASE